MVGGISSFVVDISYSGVFLPLKNQHTYTAKNATDSLQHVNFTGLSQLIDKFSN